MVVVAMVDVDWVTEVVVAIEVVVWLVVEA